MVVVELDKVLGIVLDMVLGNLVGMALGIVVGMVLANFPNNKLLGYATKEGSSRTDHSCALVPLVEHYSWKLLSYELGR